MCISNIYVKKSLNILGCVVISAVVAGSMIYLNEHCPERKLAGQKVTQQLVADYIHQNPEVVLETLAKTENFGNTIKNYSLSNVDSLQEIVANYIASNPSVLENFVRDHKDFIAETILTSDVYKKAETNVNEENKTETDENQKYADHWDELINSNVSPFVGPNDANVTVVEFFDFACGHCKALAPVMSRLIDRNPDVRFVFNPLFFIGEHSPYAAKVSIAAFKKGKFKEVYEGILTLPSLTEESINQILVDEGLDVEEIKSMIEEKEIRRGIQDIDSLSQVLGVNGVPMLLINGKPFNVGSLDDMQRTIDGLK